MEPSAPDASGHPLVTPLVTVVMIFLDAEAFIGEAIESILAQTSRDWELVLVDDGSTDGSTAIARSYAAQNPSRIRYLDHPDHANRGMSASRNAGVAAGTGAYISFLDADDIWLPERLETFLAAARAFPQAAMIYGPTLYWYSWARQAKEQDLVGQLGLPVGELLPAPRALRQFLVSGGATLPGICSLLVRRDAFEAVGGFEPSFRGLYEDQVFLSKVTAHLPVVVISEVLDFYRQHPSSACSQAILTGEYHPDGRHHPARGIYLRWLKAYLGRTGIADRVTDRAIRRQLLPYTLPLYVPLRRRLSRQEEAARALARFLVPRQARAALRRLRQTAHAGQGS